MQLVAVAQTDLSGSGCICHLQDAFSHTFIMVHQARVIVVPQYVSIKLCLLGTSKTKCVPTILVNPQPALFLSIYSVHCGRGHVHFHSQCLELCVLAQSLPLGTSSMLI